MINTMIAPKTIETTEGERRVQALIKAQLDELERTDGWVNLPPDLVNIIRHKLIRIAFGGYKIGLIVRRE